jgi:hypothetical protein
MTIIGRFSPSLISFILAFVIIPGLISPCHLFGRDYRRGEGEEIRYFTLRQMSGAIDLRYESENNRLSNPLSTMKLKRERLEERFRFLTQGSVYHSNFLDFRIGASIGLKQESFSGDFNTNQNASVYEYDLGFSFLKNKPFNANLFATRSSNLISQQFFGPIKVDTELYGSLFQYRQKLLNLSLLVQQQQINEDSLDFKRNRTEKTADFRISHALKDVLKSDFRYIYKDLEEQFTSRQETVNHRFELNNTLDYEKLHAISLISYSRNNGLIPMDNLLITENLRADHSETLKTFYDYSAAILNVGGVRSSSHRGDAGIRHKLYESLDTELKGEVSRTASTDFQEIYYGPRLFLSYRKKVPGGMFSGGYNFFYHDVARDAGAGVLRVFGERIVLSDIRRTFLANPDVIPTSVIVKDTDGVVLTEGVNYRIIQSGNQTEIQRINIPDNTTVLVDYENRSPQKLHYTRVGNGLNLLYDFQNFLSFYYSYISTRQKLLSGTDTSGTATPLLYDTSKSLYGTEMKWRWFAMTAEYEDDQSDLVPFTARRFRGTYQVSPAYSTLFTINASQSTTAYKKDNNTVSLITGDALLTVRLNSILETGLGIGYFRQEGKNIDTRALKLRWTAKGQLRSVELRLISEYLDRRDIVQAQAQDRTEFIVRLNLVRNFDFF